MEEPCLEWALLRLEANHDPKIRERALNLYVWGSRVYGTATATSDWDLMLITTHNVPDDDVLFKKDKNRAHKQNEPDPTTLVGKVSKLKQNIANIDVTDYPIYADEEMNVTFIPLRQFVNMLREHRHMALEAVCVPERFKWLESKPLRVELDADILRRTVLWEASRCLQGAGTKLEHLGHTAHNFYRARKEVVHSLRYLLFAMQILSTGTIHDYSVANGFLASILDKALDEWAWQDILKKFKPQYEALRQELKDLRYYSHFYSKRETLRFALNWQKHNQFPTLSDLTRTLSLCKGHPEDDISMNLATVRYLRNFNGDAAEALNSLRSRYLINIGHHPHYPHLVILHHDIYSIQSDVIAEECVGLVLNVKENFKVVAFPFMQFPNVTQRDENHVHPPERWNLSEKEQLADSNVNHINVFEFLDGIFVSLYFAEGKWRLASRYTFEEKESSVPIAFKEIGNDTTLFQTFWDIWTKRGYTLPSEADGYCYMLEMTSKYHRQVVSESDGAIVLIGARNTTTFKEQHPSIAAARYGWTPVKEFLQLNTLEEIIAESGRVNPFQTKGFVIVDSDPQLETWRRWKVRSPQHLSIDDGTDHSGVGPLNMKCDMDDRHMIDLLRFNRADILLSYFPHWASFGSQLQRQYTEMCDSIQRCWDELKGCSSQKDFAVGARKQTYYFMLFHLKRDEHLYLSMREYLALFEDSIFLKVWNLFWPNTPQEESVL